MEKELKIVLVVIATYLLLGFQNLVNTSVFLIPYELNPLVILSVSIFVLIGNIRKNNERRLLNFTYFIGVMFYSLLSTRTLSVLYNNTNMNVFSDLANSDFTALIAISGFFTVLIIIMYIIRSRSYLYCTSGSLLLLSFIGALANFELVQIICFTSFTIAVIIYAKTELKEHLKSIFSPVLYQLFLFVLLENTYFILIKYC